MNYRKIWESVNGPIPKDERGVTYDIHHIDGNRKNNNIINLICVSVEEHYQIHLKQFLETKSHKERASLNFLASRLGKKFDDLTGFIVSEETKNKISEKLKGTKRPQEFCDAIKKHFTGYKWSEEAIESRRQGMLKHYENMTDEDKIKRSEMLSKAGLGKKTKEETKVKLAKFNSKLSDEEVLAIDILINENIPYRIISEQFNISPAQISAIKQRKTYKWVFNK